MNTEIQITKDTLSKLEAISNIQKARVQNVIHQDYERVASFASRLQMRLALSDYNENRTQKSQDLMNKILSDAKSDIPSFKDIHILNPNGDIVASTDKDQLGTNHASDEFFIKGRQQDDISIFFKDKDQNLREFLTGPLLLGGKFIGVVAIVSDAGNLLSQFANYEGLGQTGESFMAKRTPEGDALYITPLRFDKDAALRAILPKERMDSPTLQAISKNEKTFTNLVDYRGQPVFASTRYVQDMDWGLVTKLDKAEAFAPLTELRNFTILLGVIVGALTLVVALYLGRAISRPIMRLRDAANELTKGNFEAEIPPAAGEGIDEIGEMASSFDSMRKHILSTNNNLENLVQSRTKELREVNEQLALSNQQLKSASNAQKEFINIASHELRTPIVPILNLSELLYSKLKREQQAQQQELQPEQKEELEIIEVITRNADRLLRLTEDILDVTKIESQTLKLRKERFNLNDVILNVVEDYREQIAKESNSNNNLKLMYECNDITLVEADRQRLTQVISNLLSNAIKFTKEGTIAVTKKEIKDDKKEVVIAIRDTGTGIDPEILPKLFTKFATKSYHGTGLGLYISKSIVEAHGGKMWAENNNFNRKGKGSTFYFALPIYQNKHREGGGGGLERSQ